MGKFIGATADMVRYGPLKMSLGKSATASSYAAFTTARV